MEKRFTVIKYFWFSLISLLALRTFFQLLFFVGLTGQYGEESMYVDWAVSALRSDWSYWSLFTGAKAIQDWSSHIGDPTEMYPFRVAALYPNTVFVRLFGASEQIVCLWTMICGLGTTGLIALLGRKLHSPLAGLCAAMVLTLIPGHFIYTSRLDTDMQQLFFLCLAIYLLIASLETNKAWKRLIIGCSAGISFGLLYLCKFTVGVTAIAYGILLPFLASWQSSQSSDPVMAKARWPVWQLALTIALGFMLVFGVENVIYHQLSGHWLLHWHMMHGNAVNLPSWRNAEVPYSVGPITIWIYADTWRSLFEHAYSLAGYWYLSEGTPAESIEGNIYNIPLHGWSGWALLASLPLLFLVKKKRRLLYTVLLGFFCYYLYLEFFWFYPTIEQGRLNLTFVQKVDRFLFPCYPGIALAVGIALAQIYSELVQRIRLPKSIGFLVIACLIGFFAGGSVSTLKKWVPGFRSSLSDLRSTGEFLQRTVPDGSIVYVEPFLEQHMTVFSYPKRFKWKTILQNNAKPPCDGWLIMRTYQGLGTEPNAVYATLPEWFIPIRKGEKPLLPGWEIVYQAPVDPYHARQLPALVVQLPKCI